MSIRDFEVENWRGDSSFIGWREQASSLGINVVRVHMKPMELSQLSMESSFLFPLQYSLRQAYLATSVLYEIEGLLKWLRSRKIHLPKLDEVKNYLIKFPDLIEVIPLAVEAVCRHLPEAVLTLSTYNDPDIEDSYLVLYVRLHRYDDSVMKRIEAAESEFIDILSEKEGWLQINTDFKPPNQEDVF